MNRIQLKTISLSEIGQKQNQEDSLFPANASEAAKSDCFLVCDGMGGHENGEVASQIISTEIGKKMQGCSTMSIAEARSQFETVLNEACDALTKHDYENRFNRKRMGTTMTFAGLCTDGVLIAHIGDSRVYQLRPGKGIIFQTRDHSLVNDLVAAGEITEEEARNHPQKNVITRAIQAVDKENDSNPRATYNEITDIRRGDIFFLCSDGIVEQIENDELQAILLAGNNAEKKIETLKTRCEQLQTRDNHTCYYLEIENDFISANEAEVSIIEPATKHIDPMPARNDAQMTQDATIPREKIGKGEGNNKLYIIIAAVIVIVIAIAAFMLTGNDDNNNIDNSAINGTIQRPNK